MIRQMRLTGTRYPVLYVSQQHLAILTMYRTGTGYTALSPPPRSPATRRLPAWNRSSQTDRDGREVLSTTRYHY